MRRTRRLVSRLPRIAKREREQFVGRLHPSLWLRGFLSNRWYAYPGIRDRSLPFLSDAAVEAWLETLNDPAAQRALTDKDAFQAALEERGLAASAPEVYGTIRSGAFVPRSAAARDRALAQASVVVKPVSGHGGRGVRVVAGGEVEALSDAAAPPLLVQEHLRQHRDLLAINPTSLNTLRLLAIRLEDGPVIAAAVHRWGTAASGRVDNVSSGGLCSLVDLDTGVLGPAVGRPLQPRRVEHDVHPDTGQQITGVRVPQWDEVRSLGVRLMDAFPDLEHVGWDLCASDRGPLVVEGNPGTPNPNVFQFHGSFLHDPRVRRYYVERGLLPRRYA